MNNLEIKFNNDSLIKDLFSNDSFISLFRIFLNKYDWISVAKNENEKIFLQSIIDDNIKLDDSFINNLINFFKLDYNFEFFVSFIQFHYNFVKNKDEKFFNLILEVSDYLLELKNENEKIPEWIDLLKEWINSKVIDIIPRKIENIDLKLLKYWLPKMISRTIEIKKIFEDDFIEFPDTKNNKLKYFKVIDTKNNEFYINKYWDKLISKTNWEIKNIIKYDLFNSYFFMQFENQIWEFKTEVKNINEWYYVDFWFDEYYKLDICDINNQKKLEYIYSKTNDIDDPEECIYYWDLYILNLYDILEFYFWNTLEIDEKLIEFLKIMDVKKINKTFSFDLYNFISVKTQKVPTEEMDFFSYDTIFDHRWIPLLHNKEIWFEVDNLNWFNEILWKKFLSYWLWVQNYYFDFYYNTIKINDIPLESIKKEESLWNTELFLINWEFSITKKQLEKELEKYDSFDPVFDITIRENLDFHTITCLYIESKNEFEFFYSTDSWKEKINYDNIFNIFKSETNKENFRKTFETMKSQII